MDGELDIDLVPFEQGQPGDAVAEPHPGRSVAEQRGDDPDRDVVPIITSSMRRSSAANTRLTSVSAR